METFLWILNNICYGLVTKFSIMKIGETFFNNFQTRYFEMKINFFWKNEIVT